jgi:hypothetical protein
LLVDSIDRLKKIEYMDALMYPVYWNVNKPNIKMFAIRKAFDQIVQSLNWMRFISIVLIRTAVHVIRTRDIFLLSTSVHPLEHIPTKTNNFAIRTSQIAGGGVWVLNSIPKDTILMFYTGEHISKIRPNGSSYVFLVDDGRMIDAMFYGNMSRYVNHCCGASANVTVYVVRDRVVFVSNRTIRRGEELFFNYGPEYFGTNQCICLDCRS